MANPASGATGDKPVRETVLVDLALQGGGSHGAFTWGVLDRLLEEEWLTIDGISGTSAGAMNAAALVSGYAKGGRAGARASLKALWDRVAESARFSPFQRTPLDRLLGRWSLDYSPAFVAAEMMARMVSPYDMHSWSGNPLTQILADTVDFEAIRTGPIKIFVTATNVHSGRGRVFRNADISTEALLASACLPTMFQAVEIDGEAYWDGGYSGNPTIRPLVEECRSLDTIIVPINPVERLETPRSARDIADRLNEISFNAVLLKELKMIALLRRVADPGNSEGAQWARMRVHRVKNELMTTLASSSKLNAEAEFLTMLFDAGREAGAAFLAECGHDIGVQCSFDLDALLTDV
jgi:NTE family protein